MLLTPPIAQTVIKFEDIMNKKIIFAISASVIIIIIVIVVLLLLPQKGNLVINSDQTKTKVIINNQTYEIPLDMIINTGKYSITANKEGYIEETVNTVIEKNKKTTINLNMVSREFIEPSLIDQAVYVDLPTLTDHFSIELSQDINYDIEINLMAVLNGHMNPEYDKIELENYIQQLKDYKKEALNYIKSNNIDPASIKIKWLQTEAANL